MPTEATPTTRQLAEPDFDRWGDRRDQWSAQIDAAHPCQTGDHATFMQAHEMVGNRHSKSALIALVNWLLTEKAR